MQERDLPPITRQLRDSIRNAVTFAAREEFDDLCDAIDSVHRSACTEWATMRAERESALAALNCMQDDYDTMRERLERITAEWVELPKDADGVPIHFGDVLDQFGTPMTVFAMSDPDPDQGDCMLELITDGISDGTWVRARKMRHHHAPTVEDVLREFAAKLAIRDGFIEATEETFAEYAAKLRLAGDAE